MAKKIKHRFYNPRRPTRKQRLRHRQRRLAATINRFIELWKEFDRIQEELRKAGREINLLIHAE